MKQLTVVKPPAGIALHHMAMATPSVFLGGSIEMGKAEDWQAKFIEDMQGMNLVVMSPRRDHWNPDLEQSINCPEFVEQVEWELNHLDIADHIVMNFIPGTMSPISLLEFGMYADSGKMLVCCPPGFWRKGNVEIVCKRFGIPLFENFDALVEDYLWRIPAQNGVGRPKDLYFQLTDECDKLNDSIALEGLTDELKKKREDLIERMS